MARACPRTARGPGRVSRSPRAWQPSSPGSRSPIAAADAAAVAALLATELARAQLAPLALDRGGTGLGLALRRLPVVARVLLVTAHPDDEPSGLLVRLSRGLGVQTAQLTLTRGEGGQNEIGTELDEALGVLRSEEILASHRIAALLRAAGIPAARSAFQDLVTSNRDQ